ncbi:hypothetical protein BH11VER1_BH11VER1_38710 [soil metagenome]
MDYYGYRFYLTAIGRWPSRDPIGERGGRNLYGMVGNDPVDRWDGFGLIGGGGAHPVMCCGGKPFNSRGDERCCNDSAVYKQSSQCCTSGGVKAKIARHIDMGQSLDECINDYLFADNGGPGWPLTIGHGVGAVLGGAVGFVLGTPLSPLGQGAAAAGAGSVGYDGGDHAIRSIARTYCKEKVCPSK